MAAAGEQAYAWAKASGMVGSSFLGRRASSLPSLARPSELDRLLFPSQPLQLPERELSFRLQRRISERSARRAVKIVSCFSSPPPVLVRTVRAYEYADLKACLAAIAASDRTPASRVDLGRFGTVRWESFPDLARMLEGTEFDWIKVPFQDSDLAEIETEMDRRYYRLLWRDILGLPRDERRKFQSFVAEEIVLKNIVWSMRLRSYYGMTGEDLDRRMVEADSGRLSLAAEARRTVQFALDRREDWTGWKRSYLLNPEIPGKLWRLDPRYAQNAASRRLNRIARREFRMNPFSPLSIAAFIKLVQFEEDILTSVAEGLSLGLTGKDVLAALEGSA